MGVCTMGYLIGDDMALMHPPKTAGIWARDAERDFMSKWGYE